MSSRAPRSLDLLLLYINDIGNLVNDSNEKLMLFADDSNAFIIHKNMTELKQLSEELNNKLCNWFCANKLTLNLDTPYLYPWLIGDSEQERESFSPKMSEMPETLAVQHETISWGILDSIKAVYCTSCIYNPVTSNKQIIPSQSFNLDYQIMECHPRCYYI